MKNPKIKWIRINKNGSITGEHINSTYKEFLTYLADGTQNGEWIDKIEALGGQIWWQEIDEN